MLLPRYSLRTTLIGVSTCAVFSLVLGQAVQGEGWAIVFAMSVISLCVILAFHAMVYVLCVGVTSLMTAEQTPARTSRGGVQSTPDVQTAPATGDDSQST